MKKILLAAICLLGCMSPSLQAMEGTSFDCNTEKEKEAIIKLYNDLLSSCRPFVEHPIPQYIKEKFINETLRQIPELKTRAKWIYRETYSPTHSNFSFRNIVLDPREYGWTEFFEQGEEKFFKNYYRVFIGTLCPPDLEEVDIVPCLATVCSPPPALVRTDLKEVLMARPYKGYVPAEEWREYYDKNCREKEELAVNDAAAIIPEKWING